MKRVDQVKPCFCTACLYQGRAVQLYPAELEITAPPATGSPRFPK